MLSRLVSPCVIAGASARISAACAVTKVATRSSATICLRQVFSCPGSGGVEVGLQLVNRVEWSQFQRVDTDGALERCGELDGVNGCECLSDASPHLLVSLAVLDEVGQRATGHELPERMAAVVRGMQNGQRNPVLTKEVDSAAGERSSTLLWRSKTSRPSSSVALVRRLSRP